MLYEGVITQKTQIVSSPGEPAAPPIEKVVFVAEPFCAGSEAVATGIVFRQAGAKLDGIDASQLEVWIRPFTATPKK